MLRISIEHTPLVCQVTRKKTLKKGKERFIMVNKFSISGTLVQNQDKRILLKKKRASIAITKRDDDDQ